MKKRLVSILMSSVMVVGTLAACGGTEAGTTTQVEVTDDQGNTTTVEVKDTATGDVTEEGKYEVKDLHIVVDGTLTANVDNGQEAFIEQWEAAVSEKVGHEVKLTIDQLDHSDYAATVQRYLTTGTVGDGQFPDALIMSAGMFREYQTTGLLWDMAAAYDKAEFQARVTLPEVNLGIRTKDGKQYGFAPTYGNGCVSYVKASWFNQYVASDANTDGVKTIEDVDTYEKYYNMLKFFSNINGDNKTYGVIAAGFGKLDEAPFINYMPEFWQGAYPSFYQKDGVWVDGFQEQATIDALDRLAQAYADGLIDPDTEEASTKDAREKFFSNDQSTSEGVFTYWAGTWLRTLTDNMGKNDVDNELADERLLQLPPIKEITDTWGGYINREAPVWVITDDGDDNSLREQAIFDTLFETMLDGDKVQTLWTYGAEDVHWSTKAESFTTNPDDPEKKKDYEYADGVFHLKQSPNDPNAVWKKNHLDPVLVIAPLTNGFVDDDPLVTKGNQFFTAHCVDAPVAASSETLTAEQSGLKDLKTTLMNKVVTGEMSGADAVQSYIDEKGAIVDTILGELNAQ
ncbi:MAG: hypothetical protein IK115_10730 [Lachnospiraceae bacterium]|nr:hypothetical protein [Lachnospiraceae bacterium]